MFWKITHESVHEMTLLRTIDQTLKAGDCDVTTYYRHKDYDDLGDLTKLTQACSAPEGYVSNHADKDDSITSLNN